MCLVIIGVGVGVAGQIKGRECLSVRGHTGAHLAAIPGNGVRCGLAIVGSAQQGDLQSEASPIPP
jgi:hypothetical protein